MFTKDSRTETFLTQMGVEFAYVSGITFAKLAPTWNTKNLARPVAVRENAVAEYAALMEMGSPAPATILHATPNGYDVLDGVQRLSAAQLAGYSLFPAYVVQCESSAVVSAIRVIANARLQGHAEPPEWTRRRAVELLVIQGGMTAAEVARMGGWRATDIAELAKSMEWGFVIRAIGGPDLPDSISSLVAGVTSQEALRKNAKPAAEFLSLVKEAKLSAADAAPFIAEFFEGNPSFKTLGERVEIFSQEPEIDTRLHGRRAGPMPPDVKLRSALKTALTILAEARAQSSEMPYIDEFFRLTKRINDQLHALAPRHRKAEKHDTPASMYAGRKGKK